MHIVICGSMTNYPTMVTIRDELVMAGHTVILPDPAEDQMQEVVKAGYVDSYDLKIKYDYIRRHYDHIPRSDGILIINTTKNGVEHYIGGNAFLEMGFAYILRKPIYLLNPIPQIDYYYHEMKAMEPIVLNGDLSHIC